MFELFVSATPVIRYYLQIKQATDSCRQAQHKQAGAGAGLSCPLAGLSHLIFGVWFLLRACSLLETVEPYRTAHKGQYA